MKRSTTAAPSGLVTLTPAATDFADSLDATSQSIGGITVPRTNCLGRLSINVPSQPANVLTVTIASNVVGDGTGTAELGVGVYIDGVYSQSLVPVAADVETFKIGLPIGGHTVTLVNAYAQHGLGTFIYQVQGYGISLIPPPASVSKSITIYGDSIAAGAVASPNAQNGWACRVRARLPDGVRYQGWGGKQLKDDASGANGGFASLAVTSQRLVDLANLGSPTTRIIWLAIGINDVIQNSYGSAAAFGTDYGSLLDLIHTKDSGVIIVAQSMLITTGQEGSAPAYRTQIQTLAGARSFVTFVDGTALMTAGGLSGDGLHPSTTGHGTVFTNVRPTLLV